MESVKGIGMKHTRYPGRARCPDPVFVIPAIQVTHTHSGHAAARALKPLCYQHPH